MNKSHYVFNNEQKKRLKDVLKYYKSTVQHAQIDDVLINYIKGFCQFIEDGGNIIEDSDNNIKFLNAINGNEAGDLIFYVHSPRNSPQFQKSIVKAISSLGSTVDFPLYRGISYSELESIHKRINKSSKNLRLEKAKSFSADYDIAQDFSNTENEGGTQINPTSDYKPGGVITLETRKPVFNLSQFLMLFQLLIIY